MTDSETRTLYLAKWETRFFAWLIDIVLVSAVVEVFNDYLAAVPGVLTVELGTVDGFGVFFGANGLALFVYWTVTEGVWGQSAGKRVLDLRVTDRRGDQPGILAAAGQAFGKAFFLPLDCLVGWFAMEGEKLRLTNKLTNTIVVESPSEDPEGVEYVIPEE